mmetsp:Transcript_43012/g.86968  ORF Transcript_43012/g.86968 Transcript_43012/m.86968 type:complete len:201 (-) Transcript_43012:1121-1723(-)
MVVLVERKVLQDQAAPVDEEVVVHKRFHGTQHALQHFLEVRRGRVGLLRHHQVDEREQAPELHRQVRLVRRHGLEDATQAALRQQQPLCLAVQRKVHERPASHGLQAAFQRVPVHAALEHAPNAALRAEQARQGGREAYVHGALLSPQRAREEHERVQRSVLHVDAVREVAKRGDDGVAQGRILGLPPHGLRLQEGQQRR